MSERYGWMPSRNQNLLLKVSLLGRNHCIDAWREWSSTADIDNLDAASQRLLPLAYYNLGKFVDVSAAPFPKMKSAMKKNWFKNHLLLNSLSGLLKMFRENEIKTMVLKGVPVALNYYENISLRPMGDFDLLVPWKKFENAAKLMMSEGWEYTVAPLYPVFHDSYKLTNHACSFSKSKLNCDLHWSILKHTCYDGADDDFRYRSKVLEIFGEKTETLSAEDQLIHLMEHGAGWSILSPIRWISDSYFLLEKEKKLDWDYLQFQIRKKYLELTLYGMFRFLKDTFSSPVPEIFLDTLKSRPSSSFGKKIYSYSTTPVSEFTWRIQKFFQQFLYYRIYLKDFKKEEEKDSFKTFIGFLIFRWEVKNPIFLPIIFFKRLIVKFIRYSERKITKYFNSIKNRIKK